MGYNHYVEGEIHIEPPLPKKVIDDLRLREDDGFDNSLVATEAGAEDTVGLVNGQITVIPGKRHTLLKCRYEEPFKAYNLSEEVLEVAKAVKKNGSNATGALYLSGEDSGDLTRIRIENGRVFEETPEFLWPNGDKGWG